MDVAPCLSDKLVSPRAKMVISVSHSGRTGDAGKR